MVRSLLFLVCWLVPTPAWADACVDGDQVMGPNCVHVGSWEVSSASGLVGSLPYSTVYRVVDGTKVVLWKGLGKVEESTPDYLKTKIRFQYDDEVVVVSSTYLWESARGAYSPSTDCGGSGC